MVGGALGGSTGAAIGAGVGGATDQRKGQQEHRGVLHREDLSVGMLGAILGSCEGSDKGLPTSNTTFIKYCKYLICGQNFFDFGRSECYSRVPISACQRHK
ncbi:hypothetical protein [Pseudomonas sp. Pseusp97]|uniref:hypothetical protein n=1 Tax=Pseudomonas sp. Pseusp97 TaxID=3243065 RepID=UPI0039A486FC